jgi:hypothetical protein
MCLMILPHIHRLCNEKRKDVDCKRWNEMDVEIVVILAQLKILSQNLPLEDKKE